jgi:hypothetical protein
MRDKRKPADDRLRLVHRSELESQKTGARATGASAIGAEAIGTLILGAFAIGALAIGAVAISRLAINRARIRRLEIDELVVRRLRITEELQTPDRSSHTTTLVKRSRRRERASMTDPGSPQASTCTS